AGDDLDGAGGGLERRRRPGGTRADLTTVLVDDIATELGARPGQRAAELADRLGAPSEAMVAFALAAAHGQFRRDRSSPPRWWPSSVVVPHTTAEPPSCQTSRVSPPFPLYPWQSDALAAWEGTGGRGVVEAVTGTGKTVVGISAAVGEVSRRGQVLVLVPTVELQHQWVDELGRWLPSGTEIGRLGAGSADRLSTHDVLVAVVNSARESDVRLIRRDGLLVADECHRYGSAVNHLALDPRFGRRLGLSATYARDDDGKLTWLDPYFGRTCFRLGYRRAVDESVAARFNVAMIGVAFSRFERNRYEELTELMAKLWSRLVGTYGLPKEPFEVFMQAVDVLADGGGAGTGVARAYRQAMLERRRLLADTPAKDAAIETLAPAIGDATRAIVFTQTIAASERAADRLAGRGLRTGVVHSKLGGQDRRNVLGRFATGELDAIAAPRVLDEGVDVPAADLAVISGASRSRRQMIQRMGRVLRRKPDERRARFAVLFVEDTVEDPRLGAHAAFLEEVTAVADRVSFWPATALRWRPDDVRDALRPSWAARPPSTANEA
ncbi:MAG: DEAD/DEAH box helicase, partial [Acidimicrobiales bacterium]